MPQTIETTTQGQAVSDSDKGSVQNNKKEAENDLKFVFSTKDLFIKKNLPLKCNFVQYRKYEMIDFKNDGSYSLVDEQGEKLTITPKSPISKYFQPILDSQNVIRFKEISQQNYKLFKSDLTAKRIQIFSEAPKYGNDSFGRLDTSILKGTSFVLITSDSELEYLLNEWGAM